MKLLYNIHLEYKEVALNANPQQMQGAFTFGDTLDGNAGGDPRSHVQAEFPSGWQMQRTM